MQEARKVRSTYITQENASDILRVLAVTALAYPFVAWFHWYLPFVLVTVAEFVLTLIALPRLSQATAHNGDATVYKRHNFANTGNVIIALLTTVFVGLALGSAWPIVAAFSVGLLVQANVIGVRALIRSFM